MLIIQTVVLKLTRCKSDFVSAVMIVQSQQKIERYNLHDPVTTSFWIIPTYYNIQVKLILFLYFTPGIITDEIMIKITIAKSKQT